MDEAGRELLGLLDGLPLALAQAASYIRETGLDTASYVRLYKQQWDDLMRCDGEPGSPLVDYEQGSVGTTWAVSFKAVEAKNKNAANLLRLWAFVDSRDLWRGLLQAATDGGEQWPGWLREIAGSEVRYLDAARLLLRYSMIEARESVRGSYMMHPVVHRWASHIQDGTANRSVLRLAVMVVGSSVPSSTSKDYWVVQRRLLPHAERCSWWIGEIYGGRRSFDDITTIDAMHMLGTLYADQGRLTEAESMYQRALEGYEKALGRDHTSTPSAWSLGKLMAISDPTFTSALMRLRSRTHAMAASATLMEVNNMTDKKAILGSGHEAITQTHGLLSRGSKGPVSRLNPGTSTAGPKSLSNAEAKPILRAKTMTAVEERSQSTDGKVWTGLDGAKASDSDWEIVSNWIHDTLYLARIPGKWRPGVIGTVVGLGVFVLIMAFAAQYLFPDPSFLRAHLDASTLPKNLSRLHPETLRYFSIDDSWLDCYIDGGLSVANHLDPEHDATRLSIKKLINQALATGSVNGKPIPVPRSGFVVRSAAVKAAPDLRVTVTRFQFDTSKRSWVEDESYDPLLRHTRLDDYTIFCLVDVPLDQICKINLAQPPHQQRFAFSVQPTFHPDTGAVKDITNELKISKLFTNESLAPEGNGPEGEWPELDPDYQLTTKQEAELYDSIIRCVVLGKWNSDWKIAHKVPPKSLGPYEDAVPDSCLVGLQLNDPCCKLK